MYRTIRYDKSSFHVIDPDEIKSDEDSLSRMVTDYIASRKSKDALLEKGSEFGVIMCALLSVNIRSNLFRPAYEQALAQPVRSAIFGECDRPFLLVD
jgi:hypothetical protein